MTNLIEITEATESQTSAQLPAVFGEQNLEALFQRVADEASAEIPDVETEEGRKRIRSLAAKVAKSKTAIDKPIRDHLRALKAQPKTLEKNARDSIERFDALKDSILAPLNAAQSAQDSLLARFAEILSQCVSEGQTALKIDSMHSELLGVDLSVFWPELAKKATTAHEMALTATTDTLARLRKEEDQAAELEELRKQAAQREQEDRNRKIAEDAAAAAREDERNRAQQEREQVERRAIEAKQREESSRLAAEQSKLDALAAEQRRAEQEAQYKIDAENAAKQAEARAKQAAEQAAADERQRAESEQKEVERLTAARESDKAHRIKINRAALVAFMSEGLGEDDAKKAITAIAKHLIPNIKIMY